MTSLKSAPWRAETPATPGSRGARHAVAAGLQTASTLLASLASRLAVQTPGVPEPRLATLEFYADAGAPEGALYADGYLVGWLEGVTRL